MRLDPRFWLLVLVGAMLLATALFFTERAWSDTPPAVEDEKTYCTHLQWRTGDPVVGRYNEWNDETICRTDDVRKAVSIADRNDADRWIRHRSGPQACLFTADWTRAGPKAGTIGGGRDCPKSRDDASCGYIKPGFTIYVASGKSCGAFGVDICSGWCW